MSNALNDILVVSMDQAVAAPFVASRLADAGARVIKIERPGGDFARDYDSVVKDQSAYFVWLNRGKESIALNIKHPEDAALLHRMIAKADVFIQNLAPGGAERAGFGSTNLRAKNPRLITCDISGYGETGPYRDMKAYDLLIQAETGIASVTGLPEAPGRVGISICDIGAGMYALSAIMQALYERARTGEGTAISVSLFDAMADWMSVPLLYQEHAGAAPERVGLNHPSIAPYGAYTAGDDEQLVIAIQNEREWERLCKEVLEKPEMLSDPNFITNEARVANRTDLDVEISEVFAKLTRVALAERLQKAGIAFGNINSAGDLSTHPQLRRTLAETPNGPVEFVASPVRFNGVGDAYGAVPAPDQHGTVLRKEFSD
jgi:itaconate CoA-transferase